MKTKLELQGATFRSLPVSAWGAEIGVRPDSRFLLRPRFGAAFALGGRAVIEDA